MTEHKETREYPDIGEATILHSPFYPADVRPGENIRAKIRLKTPAKEIECAVWRISPVGIEFACDEPGLTVGTEIDLIVTMGRDICQFDGIIVSMINSANKSNIIGVRWTEKLASKVDSHDRRSQKRWSCGPQFMPTGIATNPVKFNDFIHFRIRDVSLSGLQIVTSLRNKTIIPGMKLDSMISVPMVGSLEVSILVKNARIQTLEGRDYLSLGCELLTNSNVVKQAFGQFILQFGPPTNSDELKSNGFKISNLSNAVDISFAKTKEDYEKVLELRRISYVAAGKVPDNFSNSDMSDVFDARSRIIVAFYRGQVVGSARLLFPEEGELTEHDMYAKLSDEIPPKHSYIEISRVCTHPNFRGHDLRLNLLRHAVLTTIQSGRRYLVGSCTPDLLKFYESIGCKGTGITYKHGKLSNIDHVIFVGDVLKAVRGDTVGPFVWNFMYEDLNGFVTNSLISGEEPLNNFKTTLYRLFRPITKLVIGKKP